jgi:ABC-2 type transport system ATP-binding protein
MSDAILQTEGLTKRYHDRTVVDNLPLCVERGDIFGLLGQNGAGKSTLLRMVLGLVRPTSGRILLLGQELRRGSRQPFGRVGAVIEAPAFYESFSGWDNLRLFAALSGGTTRKRIEETLDLVGLRERARDPVRIYSHGMRQRLGLAQALLPQPEFILLDEPTDGLDPQGIRELRLLLPRLRDERRLTILLSSHLLHEVEHICNALAIIDHGRLLYHGATAKLLGQNELVKLTAQPLEAAYQLLRRDPALTVRRNGCGSLFLELPSEGVPRVNAVLVANNIRVLELSPQRPTLEDVFLNLTRT